MRKKARPTTNCFEGELLHTLLFKDIWPDEVKYLCSICAHLLIGSS